MILFIIFVILVMYNSKAKLSKVKLKYRDTDYTYLNATKTIVDDRLRVIQKGKTIADFPLNQVVIL